MILKHDLHATAAWAHGQQVEWETHTTRKPCMPSLLLNLRHVPDDEADEVRALLDAHRIDYYETPPNRWGISMGGIWVGDMQQAERARQLLATYQAERARNARARHEEERQAGTADTIARRFRRDPVRMLLFSAIALALLAFIVYPFFFIGGE